MSLGFRIAGALCASLVLTAAAAAPASRYSDPGKIAVLVLPEPASALKPTLTVKRRMGWLGGRPSTLPGKTYVWDKVGRVAIPSRALLSPRAEAVVLLGTRGETGSGLGQIEVRAFDGRVLGDVDLRERVTGLDRAAAVWSKTGGSGGPFPWIVGADITPDGVFARVSVCGGRTFVVNLRTAAVEEPKPR